MPRVARSHLVALLFTAGFVGCATAPTPRGVAGPASARAPAAPVALEEYFKARRLRGLSFSFDEQTVVYASDEGGRVDLWARPMAALGSPGTSLARQLTKLKGFLGGFACSPSADQLVYEADIGGDELPHLFLTNLRGEAPRDLTADYPAGRRTQLLEWSSDGKTVLFLSNLRDEQLMDLYEYDLARGKAERLWDASGTLTLSTVSFDHQRFVVGDTLSDADSNLYLVERGHPDRLLLTPHQGEISHTPQTFSRDGRTPYYTADGAGEFAALYALDLAKLARLTTLAKPGPPGRSGLPVARPLDKAAWDVEMALVSWSGRYFAVSSNADGTPLLTAREGEAGKAVALPAPPAGGGWEPLGFSWSDRYLAVRLTGDTGPTVPYVIDLVAGTARALDEALPPSLRGRKMAVGESVRVASFDGQPVPAFVYRPDGPGPFPALIDVHGGPTAQSRREFGRHRQYFVSKGYVVLVPNVRGSTGYGKSWTRLDNMDLGGGPLKDILACKQWLVKEAHVDPARVAIMGASYGGYMTLAAATFAPTEFAAHVDLFGVSDLKSLVESFPPYWAAFATFIYKKFGDAKNPADAQYQHDRSPANYLDKIQRPLLVVQGDKDARVKKDQSDRIVDGLRRRHVEVHYLVIPDEGHGFSKTENFQLAMETADRFFDRTLFGDTRREVLPALPPPSAPPASPAH